MRNKDAKRIEKDGGSYSLELIPVPAKDGGSYSLELIPVPAKDGGSYSLELIPVPEFIDPVFAKTSLKRSFSMTENERFGLVFANWVYKCGHWAP